MREKQMEKQREKQVEKQRENQHSVSSSPPPIEWVEKLKDVKADLERKFISNSNKTSKSAPVSFKDDSDEEGALTNPFSTGALSSSPFHGELKTYSKSPNNNNNNNKGFTPTASFNDYEI